MHGNGWLPSVFLEVRLKMLEEFMQQLNWRHSLQFLRTELALEIGSWFMIGVFSYLVIRRFTYFFLPRIKSSWVSKLVKDGLRFLPIFVVVWTLLHVAESVSAYMDPSRPPARVVQLRIIFLLSVVTVFVMRAKYLFSDYYLNLIRGQQRPVVDPTAFFALNKMASVFILVPAALIALQILGVPLDALLTFGGIGGLAISWAAKDVIANLFGGLMIYIHRPFVAGDWIKSESKLFEGVVEDIGWYRTKLTNFDRRPMYIPNALMTESIIENPGRMTHRRLKQVIGVRYQDVPKVEKILVLLRQLVSEHRGVDHTESYHVHLTEFGAYSVNIEIYCFVKTPTLAEFRVLQEDILLKVSQIVAREGADFAYPTQKIFYEKDLS